jgi:hypothetical protein
VASPDRRNDAKSRSIQLRSEDDGVAYRSACQSIVSLELSAASGLSERPLWVNSRSWDQRVGQRRATEAKNRLHFVPEQSINADVAEGDLSVKSNKIGVACLSAMVRRIVESGERAKSAEELLKLGRFNEAMDVAFEIEPLLNQANHLL